MQRIPWCAIRTSTSLAKRAKKEKGFVDLRRILVRGGKGGLGCFSFEHLRRKRKRRPDGADGGRGGSVEFVADGTLGSLEHLPSTIIGFAGGQGSSNNKLGANAKPRIVKVPTGTIVYNADKELVADLERPGDVYCAVHGGKGGRGNSGGLQQTRSVSFDDEAKQGQPGDERRLTLELKTLADVGLVGMPNAGKSTFLNAVSNAHPRVAPYPFTTLNPHLGVVDFSDYWRMRVADIPGILPGAHKNRGLGHNFLRHIERNAVLLYILDISGDAGSVSAVEAFETLRRELHLYRAELAQRPFLVAANKVDREGADEHLQALRAHLAAAGHDPGLVVPMAASTGQGVVDVTARLRQMVEAHERLQRLQRRQQHTEQEDIACEDDQSLSPAAGLQDEVLVSEEEADAFQAALFEPVKNKRRQ